MSGTLDGLRVVVTRQDLEPLGEMLRQRGAEAVHLPAIRATDAADGGAELDRHLAHLDRYDWLIVTSPNGAERVATAVADTAVPPRVAAVGAATSARLQARSGRAADLVPPVQKGQALAVALIDRLDSRDGRVLLAQADRASPDLADALRAVGLRVDAVTAYRTETTPPDLSDLARRPADAVLLASGSAATAWRAAIDRHADEHPVPPHVAPRIVVAIGPSTAAAAARCGLDVTAVATEHSLAGLVEALEQTV